MRTKQRRPNALQYGLFATSPTIGAEDHNEFKKVHAALIGEWQPDGATEEEAVYAMATAMWCKNRNHEFYFAALVQNFFDPSHPSHDPRLHLLAFSSLVANSAETLYRRRDTFEQSARQYLRADLAEHLIREFPFSKFESQSKWQEAICREIVDKLLPRFQSGAGKWWNLNPEELPKELREILKSKKMIQIREVYKAAEELSERLAMTKRCALSHELYEQYLMRNERCDMMIDRAMKRLMHAKAMKEMLPRAKQVTANGQLERLCGPKGSVRGPIA